MTQHCCQNLTFRPASRRLFLRVFGGKRGDGCLFRDPFWGEGALVSWKSVEATHVVLVPEEELEVFSVVFDVDEVAHEIVE